MPRKLVTSLCGRGEMGTRLVQSFVMDPGARLPGSPTQSLHSLAAILQVT